MPFQNIYDFILHPSKLENIIYLKTRKGVKSTVINRLILQYIELKYIGYQLPCNLVKTPK